ncbi:MAG: recombinase family protein, partial [Burkholderiaceae bacterium]|nr:recombinase family protein [Burkholderiaceae bacterium]
MRTVIYARYSTDRQRESSIDDQISICRYRAESDGGTVIDVYCDDATSGSTPVTQRTGGARLIADALAGKFDVLIVEGLDRLSRDQVEQERIVRRMEHRGIMIVGVADGYDSRMGARKIMRGVRGLINELYLDDLRHKTHRGQAGQVERGFVAGGKSYGYKTIKSDAGSTFAIDEYQANWIRWIFQEYADGRSAQRIAHELNRLTVKSPRGGTWAVSAIYGSPKKGSGILNNALYNGIYVWNRSQWVKDPDTGKRQRIDRPENEWKISPMPHLRIVPDELWRKVQQRLANQRQTSGKGRGRPAKTLFGGLLTCPYCGGAIVAINTKLYGCANRKDRGLAVCKGISVSRQATDAALLGVLHENLLADVCNIEAKVREIINDHKPAKDAPKTRIAELDAEITHLVNAIATIGVSETLAARLKIAETERALLKKSINTQPLDVTPAEIAALVRQHLDN